MVRKNATAVFQHSLLLNKGKIKALTKDDELLFEEFSAEE